MNTERDHGLRSCMLIVSCEDVFLIDNYEENRIAG
jgi:hypothetical protein